MKKYKLGIIGYAHSHITSNAYSFATIPERVEWVASADNTPLVPPVTDVAGTRHGIMYEVLDKLNIQKRYDCYEKMLEENELDIVLMCADNAMHPEVAEKILRRGIHVVLEKPMASTMQGALRMARAAAEGNAKIVVNWPTTWQSSVRLAYELVQKGEIGKLFKITYRNSDSQGPLSYGQQMTDVEKGYEWWHQAEAGGGALLDYCCYGACLSRWFFGEAPTAAYGLKAHFDTPFADAEDYATITVRFPEALAILEGSWTTVNTGVPCGPVLYGLEGTMVVDGNEIRVYKTRHKHEPDAVYTAEPLPADRDNLGKEVIHCLDTGDALHPTLDLPVNLDAMSILDAGIRSAVSGKLELTNTRTWCIGKY